MSLNLLAREMRDGEQRVCTTTGTIAQPRRGLILRRIQGCAIFGVSS